jgi:hypothetical protein
MELEMASVLTKADLEALMVEMSTMEVLGSIMEREIMEEYKDILQKMKAIVLKGKDTTEERVDIMKERTNIMMTRVDINKIVMVIMKEKMEIKHMDTILKQRMEDIKTLTRDSKERVALDISRAEADRRIKDLAEIYSRIHQGRVMAEVRTNIR